MSDPLLEVSNLYLEFRTSRGILKALNGITFDVRPGEIFGLVGETGCGKTVTGLSILRLLPGSAKSPEVRSISKDVTCSRFRKKRWKRCAAVRSP